MEATNQDKGNTSALPLDEAIARKVLTAVDAGLVNGLGKPIPGQMCVEAAVCYAYGLPHSDTPPCVGVAVRSFKIRLNDAKWSSNATRTAGLRALAIAQLGSDVVDQKAFLALVIEGTIRRVVPMALDAAASRASGTHAQALKEAAERCRRDGTVDSVREAQKVARAAYAADAAAAYAYAYADAAAAAADAAAAYAYAYADAAAAAAAAAYAAYAYAAYAAAAAAAAAAAYAAYAADAYAYAADADAADAADADAYAADAYAAYAYAADADAADAAADAAYAAARDEVLRVSADVALQALKQLKSPGCSYLYLLDEAQS